MSKIENGGLDQYGTEPFKKQQFRTVGIEGVNLYLSQIRPSVCLSLTFVRRTQGLKLSTIFLHLRLGR